MYILSRQRDSGPAGYFKKYQNYLQANQSRFPKGAYQLATSDWYFNFADHRCPHDGWLESAALKECAWGDREQHRRLEFKVTLLGAYHDCYINLNYLNVTHYSLAAHNTYQGHFDWRYDEFRLSQSGRLIHEIEWASSSHQGRWLIECDDVHYSCVPRAARDT